MLELKFGLFFYLYASNCDNFMFCFIINSVTITHVVQQFLKGFVEIYSTAEN